MLNGNEMHAIHVLRIYNPQKLQVRVDVPLANAAQVSVGQEATITAEVLRDTVFHGKVLRILHEADIQKNTLQVKVSIGEAGCRVEAGNAGARSIHRRFSACQRAAKR